MPATVNLRSIRSRPPSEVTSRLTSTMMWMQEAVQSVQWGFEHVVGSCSYTLYWAPWYQTWVVPLTSLPHLHRQNSSSQPERWKHASCAQWHVLKGWRLEIDGICQYLPYTSKSSLFHLTSLPYIYHIHIYLYTHVYLYTSYTAISHSSLMHIGDIHRDIMRYHIIFTLPHGFCCNIYLSPKQARYRNGLVLLSASSNVRYPKGVYLRSAAEAEIYSLHVEKYTQLSYTLCYSNPGFISCGSCFSLPW